MHIGICDDEASVRRLVQGYISNIGSSDQIYHFENAEDVRNHIRHEKPLDILYLDIDLGAEQDGMALAAEIKKSQIADGSGGTALPLVIFITGIPERMPEAFDVRAFQFLVKPINEKQFGAVMESARKAVAYAKSRQNERTITLVSGNMTSVLKISDIYYVESLGRKLIFHSGTGVTEAYGKISEIGNELGNAFFLVHRSYIVNLDRILDYGKTFITLENGEEIPMSKYKHDEFVRAYAAFLGKLKV